MLVTEGQQVKEGQPLLRLGNSESARAEVARAQEALISAERAFNASQANALGKMGEAYEAVRKTQYNLDNFDIPSDLAQGTPAEGVEKMYAKVEEARKAYEPYKYRGNNDSSQKEFKKRLDDAWADINKAIRWTKLEADLEQAQSELDDAQKEYSALTDGSQDESLARAQYETAQANLSAAEASLANVELVAPFDGVVASLNVKVGSSINAGTTAVTVADFSSWLVKTTDLTEIDVVSLAKGQAASVTLDAIPDIALNGRIESIGQTYAEKQGDIIFEVTILLTEKDPAMRWGMTAEVNFE
jgi:multidrug resistance efflux pump